MVVIIIPDNVINDTLIGIILEITILLSFEYAQEDLCKSDNKDF